MTRSHGGQGVGPAGRRLKRTLGVAAAIVAIAAGGGIARARVSAPSIALQVELVERTYCAAAGGGYVASFEMRAVYVNRGEQPVEVALASAHAAGFELRPAGDAEPAPAAEPARADARVAEARAMLDIVRLEPGWASVATPHLRYRVRVAGGGIDDDGVVPGRYRARFGVDVSTRAVGATGTPGPASGFVPTRLYTALLPLAIEAPGQVQECGDF